MESDSGVEPKAISDITRMALEMFRCDDQGGTPYRYYRFTFSANNGSSVVRLAEIFLYNSAADILVTELSLEAWVEYIPEDPPNPSSWGNAEIFLGDVSHPPGSATDPGNGDLYVSGVARPKSVLSFPLPLDGTGVIPATQDAADPTGAVLWCSVPNTFYVYGIYVKARYNDGSVKYSWPASYTIDTGTVVDITNPENAVDQNLGTRARLYRENFSGLGLPRYLRLTGFPPLEALNLRNAFE